MMFVRKRNNDLISREDVVNDGRKSTILCYPNMTVRVHYPDISDEENERRMKKLHDAAADILKEEIRKNGHP